ncbi:MAG: hypothetical protein R3B82_20905 [Sandaracinaceae bacterium]
MLDETGRYPDSSPPASISEGDELAPPERARKPEGQQRPVALADAGVLEEGQASWGRSP